MLCLFSSPALALEVDALPSGAEVVAGDAGFDYGTEAELHVHQSSDRVVIEWDSFNIGVDALTQFHQNSSSSLAVNRVVGDNLDPTQILGTLKANGRVMVLDENGVFFGENAVLDVGGIIASTGSVDAAKIMGGGDIEITGIRDGAIVNNGSITVAESGLAAFVAPTVVNNGIINAKLGRVQIGAAERVTIDLYGDGLMELAVDEGRTQTLINNGIISAQGGHVQIQAAAAKDVVDNLVVNTGLIAANSFSQDESGAIVLYAEGGTTVNTGILSASGYGEGESGGAIEVLGDVVSLEAGTIIDASGDVGGGDIKVGGDYLGTGDTPTAKFTYVDEDAYIFNDAITRGDGGRTIVWADDTTVFKGNIFGRGGALGGDGGFAETSGKIDLLAQGHVDLTAAHGDKGTYLLDPNDITIYGNFDPTFVSTDGSINLNTNLAMWLDASDSSTVTIIYSADSLSSATANGTIGTNTITTSADVSAALAVGARIRLGAAGSVTTADTVGADTYTITNVSGTTITVAENLTSTYAAQNLHRGLVTQWTDKSGQVNHALGVASQYPLYNATNNSIVFSGAQRMNVSTVTTGTLFIAGQRSSNNSNIWFEVTAGRVGNERGFSFLGPHNQVYYLNESAYLNGQPRLHGDYTGTFSTELIMSAYDDDLPNTSFGLGYATPGFNRLNGFVDEFLIYDTALDVDSRNLVEQYQSAKWGVALDPLAGASTEAAEAMDSMNGFGAFTTDYLERLSASADLVLQASNSITLDLQGDTLAVGSGRSLSLTTTSGDIDIASAGTISTAGGGDVSFTTGGAGDINVSNALILNAMGGGDLNFISGGVTNNVGNVSVVNGNRLGDLYIPPPVVNNEFDLPGSVSQQTPSVSADVSTSGDTDLSDNEEVAAGDQSEDIQSRSVDCLVSMKDGGCAVQ
ncbi:filamentous hemagglutinin N-terminal domain-containing protein [Alphaproteobacteria bacterium]|nr:filamentous hemagglutinin N-terminal domain-containing protein [Alphaproteobacteria bacterium]